MSLAASTRSILGLLGAAALVGGCTYSAEESFSFESLTPATGTLTVTSFNGSILLTRDPTATKVHGTITVRSGGYDNKAKAREAARQTAVIESGDTHALALAVQLPGGANRSYFGVDFDLSVPDGVLVGATTNDGAISVDGLPTGGLTTTNGQIELRFTSGDAVLRTVNGPIVVDSHEGPLDARTTNAPLDLSSVSGDPIRGSTTNGFVSCRALPPYGGEVYLTTSNAGVDLTLPFDYGAQLVATTTNGNIYVEGLDFYPVVDVPGQLEGELGDAAGLVDIRTNSADVAIHARQ